MCTAAHTHTHKQNCFFSYTVYHTYTVCIIQRRVVLQQQTQSIFTTCTCSPVQCLPVYLHRGERHGGNWKDVPLISVILKHWLRNELIRKHSEWWHSWRQTLTRQPDKKIPLIFAEVWFYFTVLGEAGVISCDKSRKKERVSVALVHEWSKQSIPTRISGVQDNFPWTGFLSFLRTAESPVTLKGLMLTLPFVLLGYLLCMNPFGVYDYFAWFK